MTSFPTALQSIDLLLIGMALALNLLLIGQLWSERNFAPVCIAAMAFCFTIPTKLLVYSPALVPILPDWIMVLRPLADLNTVFFWWFALALFNDRFRWRRRHIVPALVVLALSIGGSSLPMLPERTGEVAARLVNLALLAHIISLALRRYEGDLVDERRRFRVALALAVSIFAIAITGTQFYTLWVPEADFSILYAAGSAALSYIFILWSTTLRRSIFFPQNGEREVRDGVLSAADRIDLSRLDHVVKDGICLEPGLTIGTLAGRLDMPEHRLRRIINQGLGYRNFSAFLNDHRIEEAKRRLADPALAREQIIQHAYALGYVSLAPFNRAFRERVGVSPTEFRNAALSSQVKAA